MTTGSLPVDWPRPRNFTTDPPDNAVGRSVGRFWAGGGRNATRGKKKTRDRGKGRGGEKREEKKKRKKKAKEIRERRKGGEGMEGISGNGLRRELQNRNFIQWCNTLGNTRRITKLPVGGYRSFPLSPFHRSFSFSFRFQHRNVSFPYLPYLSFVFSSPSSSFSLPGPGSGRVVEISLFDYPLFDEVDRARFPLSRMPKTRSLFAPVN